MDNCGSLIAEESSQDEVAARFQGLRDIAGQIDQWSGKDIGNHQVIRRSGFET